IAGPERITALAIRPARSAALLDRAHRKCAGALKPYRLAEAPVQLEKGIAVAGRAMAQVRALGERSGMPDELAGAREQPAELRVGKGGVGEGNRHAGSAVAPLDEAGRFILGAGCPIDAVGRFTRVE